MIPTPNLDHISSKDYENVYEPAEDTFLLLDALEKDAELLRNEIAPCISLEIGSGTGCVSTFLGKILGDGKARGFFLARSLSFLQEHINPYASYITIKTGYNNSQVQLESITTNLANGLLPRLYHSVDIICCNPPYVVTTSEELYSSKSVIERAWAGGIDGREVIDKMLPLVDELLSDKGVFYLLLISENKPNEIRETMKNDYNLQSKVVLSRLAGREKQSILRFWRDIRQ
ncbi:10216_t:CDS:2 [Funneliformis mosseae]|uniref:10216_t:CDS:1 n=1 Tax=Funneliformis mosseae TaxID=27381 RepID=A0A9N9ES54_FUNMO|nr:10216_t:CDS:2 [Funneliformis mosseae]